MIIDEKELNSVLPTANWKLIPEHMRHGLKRWVGYGIKPGDFLTAILCNDLMESVRRADDVNRLALPHYATFLASYAPIGCFGSKANFDDWNKSVGLKGLGMMQ